MYLFIGVLFIGVLFIGVFVYTKSGEFYDEFWRRVADRVAARHYDAILHEMYLFVFWCFCILMLQLVVSFMGGLLICVYAWHYDAVLHEMYLCIGVFACCSQFVTCGEFYERPADCVPAWHYNAVLQYM